MCTCSYRPCLALKALKSWLVGFGQWHSTLDNLIRRVIYIRKLDSHDWIRSDIGSSRCRTCDRLPPPPDWNPAYKLNVCVNKRNLTITQHVRIHVRSNQVTHWDKMQQAWLRNEKRKIRDTIWSPKRTIKVLKPVITGQWKQPQPSRCVIVPGLFRMNPNSCLEFWVLSDTFVTHEDWDKE